MKLIILIAIFLLAVQAAPESRIYNGTDIPVGETVPWHCHLVITGNADQDNLVWIGSGAYIGGVYVITTARNTKHVASMSVQMGHRDRASLTAFTGTAFTPHPDFDPLTLLNNIGIIQLTTVPPVTDGLIEPILLPSSSELGMPPANFPLTVTGFGFTNSAGTVVANILQRTNKVVLTDAACQLTYPHLTNQLVSNFCADDTFTLSNICGGDEGGAAVFTRLGNPIMVGITNFRYTRQCDNVYPSAYVRIHSYLTWINEITGIR